MHTSSIPYLVDTISLSVTPLVLVIKASMVLNAENSRKEFLAQAAALTSGLLFSPTRAMAAKYGGFGAASPEVLDPSQAEVDSDVMRSDSVQKSIAKIKSYLNTVREMQNGLEKDPQLSVKPIIMKQLDFADLRTTLNTFNTAFEEDTQRGTDRLIRVILQDITELEIANQQKDGIPRSPRRLDIMQGKLAKLDQAFVDYLAFAK
jgi:hypothetical protein